MNTEIYTRTYTLSLHDDLPISKGDILGARRGKEPAKGTLDLPGGFVDNYETGEEAVAREVMEETGLKVDEVKYLFSLPNIYPYSGIVVHTLDQFYECRINDMSQISAMDDVADLMWIAPKEIKPELFGLTSINKGVKKYIDEFICENNQGYVYFCKIIKYSIAF